MLVQEKTELISGFMTKLFDFVRTDETIQDDFNSYLNTIHAQNIAQNQLQSALMPYIFERRVGEKRQTVFELFEKSNNDISKEEKSILKGLKNSISSVFEVKKVLKIGFNLYNLINEQEYAVLSMVKMSNFRGVSAGQYLIGRIFKFEKEYYVLEVNEVISSFEKEKVFKFAVAKQLQDSTLIYKDNKSKKKEIEDLIARLEVSFDEFFGSKEFITTNKNADDLIAKFNDYFEEGTKTPKEEIQEKMIVPQELKYFEVKELKGQSFDFLESASEGFSSHSQTYDVGVVFDSELGLYILPFYGTFKKIFETVDYKTIDGYKDCIVNYLRSSKIPPFALKRAYDKDNEKFNEIIKDVLQKEYDFDELIKIYKAEYLEDKKFSSTTVLYSSKIFSDLMELFSKEQEKEKTLSSDTKVGRNDICPCGSGKKYKKCCL